MKIKLSKIQWEEAGKKAGWMKTADERTKSMSIKDMQRAVYEILMDTGDYDEKTANDTVDGMAPKDLERYLEGE